MEAEPTVFVLDEDPATSSAIQAVGALMNLRCMVFRSGQEFWEKFDRTQCGCLVMELKVSDASGLRILERLVEEGPTLPVIFVTAHGTLPLAVRAMRAGAFHFLEKPCREQELWDAIQEAIAMDRELRHTQERSSAIQKRLSSLTIKEEEVLWMIAEGKTNRAIARELSLSIRTIEVRRNGIVKKLGIESAEELTRFAMSLGNGHSEPHLQNRCLLRKGQAFRPVTRLARVSG